MSFLNKKNSFLFSFLCGAFCMISAQNVSLEDAIYFKYSPKSIEGGQSLNDGEHYTLLTRDGVSKFSYKNTEKVADLSKGRYSDYSFSPDENLLLLEKSPEEIYRRSKRAKYAVKNLKTGQIEPIFKGNKIQEPTFSPDGTKVAFVFENNLYYQDLATQKVTQVSTDGKKNEIINGVTDWVYEEEFSFVRAFDWSADSQYLAYLKFDESQVPVMNIDVYRRGIYPDELSFKYPKAGEKNSVVSAEVYNLNDQKTATVNLAEYKDFYIPRIQFNPYNDDLYLLVSNRHQNQVDVLQYNPANNQVKKLFSEKDKAWIDTDHFIFKFLDKDSFLWGSERDGFRHLYRYNTQGKLLGQVTKGNWEVTKFYGYDPKSKKIFFQSTEPGSINRGVYSVNLNGKDKKALATQEGINSALFSKNFRYFILTHSQANKVPVYTLNDGNSGKVIRVLEDNKETEQKIAQTNFSPKEFSVIHVNGQELNAYMIKPKDFDPKKKYPLLMYLYNGPGSQEVKNASFDYYFWWFQYLASHGYIVAVVDGRGTGYKGAAFKKVTYKNLGKLELEDQIAAAKYFGSLPYVDKTRIGMFGWSFGGYMTLLAMTKGADTFKTGIAVAPVTNWRLYDTVYTERFLQTPQENEAGYEDNSPLNYANLLKGNLLLIHGSADDNVHVQNSMLMNEALVQNNKDFDFMIYPDKNHGIYGGNTRLHLFRKISDYIFKNL
ncbi:S9 family peptidase [Ornithobacterium rhinotracheale]|uniref:S9 family peptidase n=1 Tax=Ornithobacterium rhinotracheale TaxID=28251 RepID=UPI003FA4CD0A